MRCLCYNYNTNSSTKVFKYFINIFSKRFVEILHLYGGIREVSTERIPPESEETKFRKDSRYNIFNYMC